MSGHSTEAGTRFEAIRTEVREFLFAHAADMTEDDFELLVRDVAQMRLRDEMEQRARPESYGSVPSVVGSMNGKGHEQRASGG
ncbi:MAG: hypothetical protein ABJE47_23880 [bacterium]